MSGFIGAAQPVNCPTADDLRLRRLGLGCGIGTGSPGQAWAGGRGRGRGRGFQNLPNYRTAWWPGSRLTGDEMSDCGPMPSEAWDLPTSTKGKCGRWGYAGIARDAYDTPLAGATVKIFLTDTIDGLPADAKMSEDVIADAAGAFLITTPYYVAHWLYLRKAGSPEVAGVSVSTGLPNT